MGPLVFYAVPSWQLVTDSQARAKLATAGDEERLQPAPFEPVLFEAALTEIEYRGFKAKERALTLLALEQPAVFARSPGDLPALLRMADQLAGLAGTRSGERAHVWKCACGVRYAVPSVLVRPMTLPCERCGNVVELDRDRSLGETRVTDPHTTAVNAARLALAEFFREAMARGWPVLVGRP
jgi:hypothetical protein